MFSASSFKGLIWSCFNCWEAADWRGKFLGGCDGAWVEFSKQEFLITLFKEHHRSKTNWLWTSGLFLFYTIFFFIIHKMKWFQSISVFGMTRNNILLKYEVLNFSLFRDFFFMCTNATSVCCVGLVRTLKQTGTFFYKWYLVLFGSKK